ncbi:MAG TPA: glycosyltransferase, partial [Thermoanaerobaculia bacterium]|nr:glycosyltransferase [Thermoanaerobaculia bacterium]
MKLSRAILGVSFDGLAISGIVGEFVNVAAVLRAGGARVLLDLGFDITLGRTPRTDRVFLPSWVTVIRALGDTLPSTYGADLVDEVFSRVVAGTSVREAGIYDEVCRELAALLVSTLERENVHLLIVENGTLPDNPLITEALVLAIQEYGSRHGLGKYVLWRDADLMWSVEPHLYGEYPYPGVRKPQRHPHIHYAVVTEWMRRRMEAWAPGPVYHVIPNRFFSTEARRTSPRSLRRSYRIPEDAYLVARCTRIIPQKSIERDLRLFHEIQRRLEHSGDPRRIYLFVSGPVGEDPGEYERLHEIETTLAIAGQVVWADGLRSMLSYMPSDETRFTIGDVLAESDLSSFLTTYD